MFFLFLGKNFLEKLILYFLEFSFRYYGYMKKITASLDVKFIIACTRAFQRVLATRVSSIFFTIFEISLQNQTYYFLTNLYRCVELQSRFRRRSLEEEVQKARNSQNKIPANQHFIGTRANQSPRTRTIQSQVTKPQNFKARNVAFVERTYHFISCNYQFFIEELCQ